MRLPGRFVDSRWFVLRGAAIITPLAVLDAVSRPGHVPAGVYTVLIVAWALFGWNTRRPWLSFGAAVAVACLVARWRFGISWGVAGFALPAAGLFGVAELIRVRSDLRREQAGVGGRSETAPATAILGTMLAWAEKPRWLEAARWLLAAGAGVVAFHPYLRSSLVGSDDARWYLGVVTDHLLQWRGGHGPVFVGQTEYAAMGDVFPLRIAPYLQHLTAGLDRITFRALAPATLLNLAVLVSGAGAGLAAYLSAASIASQHRGAALLLAWLYVSCPGTVALAYTGDLFMSCMTAPYPPIVLAGVVRSFGRSDGKALVLITAGCSAAWLGHTPIGFWLTALAAGTQVIRLIVTRPDWRTLWWSLAGMGLFLLLCGYVFVSWRLIEGGNTISVSAGQVLENVSRAFPAALRPVSPLASQLSDFQLGYGLWGLLALGAGAAVARRRPSMVALALAAGALIALLLPVPWLTATLWQAMPSALVNLTNACPMQRLYLLLAAVSATLAACAFGAESSRPWWRTGLGVALLAAVIWSGSELRKFFRRGELLVAAGAQAEVLLRPENRPQTRYAMGLIGLEPRYFSHGVMDPEMEHRILAQDRRGYVVTNYGAVAPEFDHWPRHGSRTLPGNFEGQIIAGETHVIPLRPHLRLEPGFSYLLAFEFLAPKYDGVLQLRGNGFYREYILPSSGLGLAFGSGLTNSRVIPLRAGETRPVELQLEFTRVNSPTKPESFRHFARYELIPYDRARLPIRLDSLWPYVVHVDSPRPGWLETFRLHTRGWTATLDGRPVAVKRSPNGLVMVPIPAGRTRVQLEFRPPRLLVLAYGLTGVSWAAVLTWAVWHGWRTARWKTSAGLGATQAQR